MSIDELLSEVEQLPLDEKWAFFKRFITLLEVDSGASNLPPERDAYLKSLRKTHGSLEGTGLKRHPQGDYDERESLT